jgi:hypothetical protein
MAVRGRPPRLAHLVPGSAPHQRRERALAALLGTGSAAGPARAEPGPAGPAPSAGPGILCLPNPEWLPHQLTVLGPGADLTDFRAAARGPGFLPWSCDYQRWGEDWTNQLLTRCSRSRELSAHGARWLAREARALIEGLDLAAADRSADATCPLDLHALVPLPAALLRLGPEEPAVIAWLWEHWGTTWMLRRVQEIPVGRAEILVPQGEAAVCYRFWSADWTPWRALEAVRRRWPSLTLHVRPLSLAE